MRTQIGWYSPGSKRFCYSDVKEAHLTGHEDYTIPVFADDESNEVMIRILRNQLAILRALSNQSAAACQLTEECIKKLLRNH